MGFFRGREADTVEVVRQKLETAEAEEIVAEGALRASALEAALSDDPALATARRRENLNRAREAVELYRHALVAAEEAERQAVAKAQAALRASQNRAIRQKVGAMVKAAARYQEATAECVSAYREMVAAGDAVKRLLPAGFHDFAVAVSTPALDRFCLAELGRVGAEHPLDQANPIAPNAEWYHPDVPHGSTVKQLSPLADRLKDRLLQNYRHLVGAAPPPIPIPVADPEPRRNKPALPAVPDLEPTPPAEPSMAVWQSSAANVRSHNMHPHDAEARAGFALELAIARGEIELAPVAVLSEVEPVELADPIDADAEPTEAVPVEVAAVEVETVEAAADPMAPVAEVEPIQAAPALQASLGKILSRR
jgi:hypothetical protein